MPWKAVGGDTGGMDQEHVAGQGGAKAAVSQEGMGGKTLGHQQRPALSRT